MAERTEDEIEQQLNNTADQVAMEHKAEEATSSLEAKLNKEHDRAERLAQENLKLQDKLKKSALTDKDKRELTMAVKSTTTDIMDPIRYEQLRILARDMFASQQVPSTYITEAQVFSAMQIGLELGFGPREAVLNGYFVGGRYEIWGKAVGALLRRNGWRWRFTDEDEGQVTAILDHYEPGAKESDETIEDSYTYEEAELSGFTTHTNKYTKQQEDSTGWKPGANRKRKLRYGVLALVLHTYIPNVMGSATGVAEYSEGYLAAAATDQAREDGAGKTERKDSIAKAMGKYNGKPLEEVKPRAVETEPRDTESRDEPEGTQ